MEIQKSNLNEQIIKALINKNYGIEIMKIEKINRGTANIFKIKSNDKVYILKEFSEGRTEESVIKETNIINFLKEKGIDVPVYIKSKQNSFYIKFENRIIILQECIDGYTMENNTGDYQKTIESAKILGKMTQALKDYEGLEEDGIIEKWFSKESLENGIIKMEDLINKLNLPIIWEVMRSYSYVDEEAKNGELNIDTLVEYVKKFAKYVQLNKYDLKYAAQLYLIQIVSSPFGYKQYNDDYEKKGLLEFALFRTNLCRYLYNNSKEISTRLQKEVNSYTKV